MNCNITSNSSRYYYIAVSFFLFLNNHTFAGTSMVETKFYKVKSLKSSIQPLNQTPPVSYPSMYVY